MARIAVVGAGPAGCAAAWALGRAGAQAVLFERGRPGKDKPCGDALLPRALDELAALGVHPVQLALLGGTAFHSSDWDGRLGAAPGWLVPRAALDQALRERAAMMAELRYETAVPSLRPLERGVELEGHGRFDAVVLAEGGAAPLARSLGLEGRPLPAAAVSGYVRGGEEGVLHFEQDGPYAPGYAWDFPLGGGRSNGGVFLRGDAKRLHGLWRERLAARGDDAPARGGFLPLWSGEGRVWHHPSGVLSCGDGAGLAHPRTGEGISGALASGRRAGQAAAGFLKDGLPALESYSAWVRNLGDRH